MQTQNMTEKSPSSEKGERFSPIFHFIVSFSRRNDGPPQAYTLILFKCSRSLFTSISTIRPKANHWNAQLICVLCKYDIRIRIGVSTDGCHCHFLTQSAFWGFFSLLSTVFGHLFSAIALTVFHVIQWHFRRKSGINARNSGQMLEY